MSPADLAVVRAAARIIADAELARVALRADHERVVDDAEEEGVTVRPLVNVPACELLAELIRLLPDQCGRVDAHVAGPWVDDWRISAGIGACTFPMAACSVDIETVHEVRRGLSGTWDTGRWEARAPDTDGDEHTSGRAVSVHDTEDEAREAAAAHAVSLGWRLVDGGAR